MAIDNTFMVKKIQKRTQFIVAYCAYTNMPLVVCDPVSFNDQIFIFERENLLQEFAKEYTEKKMLLRGVQYKNRDFLRFFASLYTLGVNELVFIDNGARTTLPLESLVTRPDYSKLPAEQRPVTNPNLQLTGLYFMQEAGRGIPNEEKEDLQELEEEFASNLLKARYIIPIELNEGPGSLQDKLKNKEYRLPILKDKQDNTFQPVFTDPFELEKFSKGKKLSAVAVPFIQLPRLLSKEVGGYMLNPGGFHITLPRPLLEALSESAQDPLQSAADAAEKGPDYTEEEE